MHFEKYHGCGNDFIITEEELENPGETAQKWCDRNTGIGADGLILIRKNPLTMKIYNCDGSEADMCGNGIRVFADYCVRHKIINLDYFVILTKAGYYNVKWHDNGVIVEMNRRGKAVRKTEIFGQQVYELYEVNAGVLHFIIFAQEDIELVKFLQEKYPMANIDFVHIISKEKIELFTYERGVGKTLACGTGATAAYITLLDIGLVNDKVEVVLKHGSLFLWNEDQKIFLEGPAQKICNCEVIK